MHVPCQKYARKVVVVSGQGFLAPTCKSNRMRGAIRFNSLIILDVLPGTYPRRLAAHTSKFPCCGTRGALFAIPQLQHANSA